MQFNETAETVEERTRSTNHEGGESFDPDSPELALTKVVINNLLENTYYESAEEQLQSVEQEFEAVAEENPEFVLKLAKYARQEENLRQIPQALFTLAVNDDRTKQYARDYAEDIMSRADEPLDVLAFHVSRHGKTIPHPLKKGIEDAMHNWNEYQYSKWDQPSKEWQYRDLLNLVHPNPRDEQRERIFEKIAYGELDDYDVEPLRQEDTWESSLSKDDDRSKEEKYREQLEEDNMGLFPRIRQARDMLESGVTADEIYGDVSDEWIRNSRLYPFRYYQSYKAVKKSNEIPHAEKMDALDWLEGAMEVSTENLPDVLEDTFVAVDTSGSMGSPVSNESSLRCDEISTLFGALLYKRGADVAAFASDIEEYDGDPRDSVMSIVQGLRDLPIGGGTNGYKIPHLLEQQDADEYEQVIVFTDMQMWGSGGGGLRRSSNTTFNDAWRSYRSAVNPEASLYLVDLQSYGDLATPEGERDVYNISGWTSNIVDYVDKMEHVDAMIREIESVEPSR